MQDTANFTEFEVTPENIQKLRSAQLRTGISHFNVESSLPDCRKPFDLLESTESDYIKRRGCIELKSSEDLNDHDQSASPPFKGNTGKLAMIKGMSTILSGMKAIGDAD